MFRKITVLVPASIFNMSGLEFKLQHETVDAWEGVDSVFALHKFGMWSFLKSRETVDFVFEEEKVEPGIISVQETPLSGLRHLIGQDMKSFSMEFK